MTRLLHITERALWDAAREAGTYEMSTRGKTLGDVGFIHCSLPEQLPGVAAFLYGGYDGPDELVVLDIDSARVTAPVRFEAARPGAEEFPHIYGPLPVDAVVEVSPWGAS
ncbi:DUF952 domain-containing protein [Streptomyces venezuelae]|uniref:DUF952 domain-containing protein n=1 Tax=Streptomyces venezuelae TaxID=54571 RepID=A0A5P2CXJ0_STRVZ|nr:DUF952 domain-containing protein [Streptomyces venezuelae]QES45579.1 DUF952 domain-containing protein [Streptomyces venezuelae]